MSVVTLGALGLIETDGFLPLVTAVDGALKAARITLESRHLVGGGLSTATVRGDVGSVRAALSAADAIIKAMGADGMTHIIARPDSAVWAMLERDGLCLPSSAGQAPDQPAELPAVKSEAGLPVLKEEAEVPALRTEAEVPAIKAQAGLPAVQEEPGPGGKPKAPAEPAPKTGDRKPAAKPRKPRKPGKK